MNQPKSELLDALRTEMILLHARSIGATNAWESEARWRTLAELQRQGIAPGTRVNIPVAGKGVKAAFFDDAQANFWHSHIDIRLLFNHELKTGKPAKNSYYRLQYEQIGLISLAPAEVNFRKRNG